MSTQEALFKARQKNFDLVEVSAKANPPVCKIIDFKKFKYQEDKKQRAGKKGAKKQDLKEIRLTPFIAKKDFEVRVNRAKEFLNQGHKIKLTVRFVGRQITRKQFGYDLLKRALEQIREMVKIESEPKFQGRLLTMTLAPKQQAKKGQKEIKKNKNAQTKNKKISSKKV